MGEEGAEQCSSIEDLFSRSLPRRGAGESRIVYSRFEEHPDPEPGPSLVEAGLPSFLSEKLEKMGVRRLYRYQWEAYRAIRAGRHVVIVSGTGTGKTEAFILPILSAIDYGRGGVQALLIYPTKALARDQVSRIRMLLPDAPGAYVGVYDGDTPEAERRRMAEHPPPIMVTNPDMMHYGLMHSERFRRLIRTSRYIVLDEAHVYEGVFGSHVKAVIERMMYFLSSEPVFIASGATIGNPEELGALLFGRRPDVIRGPMWRRGSACRILLSAGGLSRWSFTAQVASLLARHGMRVLVFTDSQQMAELVARIARRSHGLGFEVHRAGLMPEDRRSVEEKLRRGVIPGVVATPTLELGINIGVLDAVVMASPPPSYAKYVQRAGRAGRRGLGVVATILGDDPIDAYYERNPREFFDREVEPTVMEPDNEEVLKLHAAAMMLERGWIDTRRIEGRWMPAIRLLISEGLAVQRGARVYPEYRGVRRMIAEHGSLRGAGPMVRIVAGRRVIGFRELPMALYDLHPSAIYLHGGRLYRVEDLDLELRVARVRRIPEEIPFYTRPIYTVDLEDFRGVDERTADSVPVAYGDLKIRVSVEGYVIRSMDSRVPPAQQYFEEPISWSYRTKGILTVYPTLADRLGFERSMSGIHAVEHVVISAARIAAGAGQTDLGGISYPSGHVVIYDSAPGGSGVAKLLYKRLEKAHRIAYEIVSSCTCEDGCPRCVYSPYCGNNNKMLSRRAAVEILRSVLEAGEKPPLGSPSGKPVA